MLWHQVIGKPNNWDPSPGMLVLTRKSGEDQKLSSSVDNSCQVQGKVTRAKMSFKCKGWNNMAQGIWCLRELAVPEIIFSDNEQFPNNLDSIQCTENMRQKFVWNRWVSYASSLGVMSLEKGEQKVELTYYTWRNYDWHTIHEETISAPLRVYISSMDRLIKNFQNLKEEIEEDHKKLREEIKEEIFRAPPVQNRDSAWKPVPLPIQEKGYTPWSNLCFYLYEHGEHMRKWDGKHTSALAPWVERKNDYHCSAQGLSLIFQEVNNEKNWTVDGITDSLSPCSWYSLAVWKGTDGTG